MQYIVICLIPYAALLWFDILPKFKKKEWKALSLTIPVYILTLVMNFMIGFGFQFPSPIKPIYDFFAKMFHL